MTSLIPHLTALLSAAQSPAVLFSGGKDSTLLLALCRRIREVPIIWFRDGTADSRVVEQLILDWQLTAYSWAPANIYTVADGDRTALVSEYSINGELLPQVTDLRGGGSACLPKVFPLRTPQLYLPFDLLLTGYKDSDTHWLADGTLLFPEGLTVGGVRMVAPLRALTDDDVFAELETLGMIYQATAEELAICSDCLAGRPLHWDQPLDLTAFKRRMKQ